MAFTLARQARCGSLQARPGYECRARPDRALKRSRVEGVKRSTGCALMLVAALFLTGCSEPAEPTVNLHRAVEIGDIDQVSRHIYWKSDLAQPDAHGDPPLHVAARAGRVAIARALARNGADPAAPNAAGKTPLHVALEHGRTQVAEMLIDQGAPLDAQGTLVDLIEIGEIKRETLNFLLDAGAQLGNLGSTGEAPLHIAIRNGHLETVRRLILAGADVNQPADDGRLPLRIARESAPGRDARFIVSTLERNGARAEPTP
ncbi:ankyrin repeat domain-containing protein [Thiocapsa sp.]|uniref:ankyrin repeat domain-containing protein n=1 Tax=Thiocapsa sp. TaxID=2024551 RepID=UPI0025F49443|nr:ankyrin repeat domain-containing protein [Thiocapsa sp.]